MDLKPRDMLTMWGLDVTVKNMKKFIGPTGLRAWKFGGSTEVRKKVGELGFLEENLSNLDKRTEITKKLLVGS